MRRFSQGVGILLLFAICFGTRSYAQDSDYADFISATIDAFEERDHRGDEAITLGFSQAEARQYTDACQSFKLAAIYFKEANQLLSEDNIGDDYALDFLIKPRGQAEESRKMAVGFARKVCAAAHDPAMVSPSKTQFDPVLDDFNVIIEEALSITTEAQTAYEAGDVNTACTKGRRGADLYERAYLIIDNTSGSSYSTVQQVKAVAEHVRSWAEQEVCKRL